MKFLHLKKLKINNEINKTLLFNRQFLYIFIISNIKKNYLNIYFKFYK